MRKDETLTAHAHEGPSPWFERISRLAIIATFVVFIWGLLDHTDEELIEHIDVAILCFFGLEALIRIKADGRNFWRDGWLVFDIAVIILGLPIITHLVGMDLMAVRVMRIARFLHISRHLRHVPILRLLPQIPALVRK